MLWISNYWSWCKKQVFSPILITLLTKCQQLFGYTTFSHLTANSFLTIGQRHCHPEEFPKASWGYPCQSNWWRTSSGLWCRFAHWENSISRTDKPSLIFLYSISSRLSWDAHVYIYCKTISFQEPKIRFSHFSIHNFKSILTRHLCLMKLDIDVLMMSFCPLGCQIFQVFHDS